MREPLVQAVLLAFILMTQGPDHNILMMGSPGSGRTVFAQRVLTNLPSPASLSRPAFTGFFAQRGAGFIAESELYWQ